MYETRTFCRAVCDQCGMGYEGYESDWFLDEDTVDEEADNDDWQIYADEHGVTHHRCPKHWQLTCSECGITSEPSTIHSLLDAGWDWSEGYNMALCATCAKTLTQKQEEFTHV